MKLSDIDEAAMEAARFLGRVQAARCSHYMQHGRIHTGKESGALRRASMDLTRALAKMRRGDR